MPMMAMFTRNKYADHDANSSHDVDKLTLWCRMIGWYEKRIGSVQCISVELLPGQP